LIVLGLAQMFGSSDRRREGDDRWNERVRRGRWVGGTWWLFVGVVMLMHQNHWLRLTQSWPLFIIAGGVSILFGGGRGPRRER
jgi:hypothetical protein